MSYVEPWAKKTEKEQIIKKGKKFKLSKTKGLITSAINGGKIWYRSDQYYVSYSAYDKNEQILIEPTFFYFDENNKNTKIVTAERAEWGEGGIWTLLNAETTKKIAAEVFPEQEEYKQVQLLLREEASEFDRIDDDLNTLGPIALFQFVSQIRKSGISSSEYEVFFLDKVARSLICLLFALAPWGVFFPPTVETPLLVATSSLPSSLPFVMGGSTAGPYH